ncbi:MAG TPA: hypothetical protein VIT24_11165 [Acidimicrobiales bacterium]
MIEVTTFGLRLVASGLATYVTLVLVAVLLASLRLLPSTLRRAVDRWTSGGIAGGIRRLVGASVIALGVLPLQPVAAQADPAPPVLAPADLPEAPSAEPAPRLEPLAPTTTVPTPAAPLVPHPPEARPPTPSVTGPVVERSVTVAVGDSFWSIAEQQVTTQLGRTPTDTEVVEPWLALIDANRDRLVDPTDPDLLHPGQVLRLPNL